MNKVPPASEYGNEIASKVAGVFAEATTVGQMTDGQQETGVYSVNVVRRNSGDWNNPAQSGTETRRHPSGLGNDPTP